jgi:hypothetical protein
MPELDQDPDEELSLRDTLDAAFDKQATDEVDAPREPGGNEPISPVTDARARDEHGRFVPKAEPAQEPAEPAQAQAQPAARAPITAAPQPVPVTELKPPASWRPEAREKWASVDPTIRQEVYRREHEAQQVLQDSAGMRQFMRDFEMTVRPYEVFIRQEGASPLAAVQNLMQTAADLRVGTPQHKVELVADVINRYGIDLKLLDDVLSARLNGSSPSQGSGQQPQQFRDPRFDQFLATQQQMLQQQQEAQENQWRSELQQFAQTHEFYADVADVMADLVESKTKRGQPVDVEKIYEQACKMHDGVSTILSQRGAAARSNGNSQAVLRAKRAASSVKGDPTPEGATVPKDDSVRAAIEAAIETTGRV